ncbi:FtsK/SpoIIIE domain-containing protein [Frigoribacterium sp. Leaf186]|uniref:FtsK/SpoIIIE domain-containing protein n=1 Tax=Frigoribacterium sp. Leaf186 TaxID=1736293 RepID=UPI0006FA909C|nr:FtsK/SpoIIIE domain-containing protein [Frigoribacterium sp. Leaf186]KQS17149.1 hypothetical protein ASG05_06350 [Frigoribacterium sp. Leaf186]
MRLKLTLIDGDGARRGDDRARDLAVTVDITASVGDIARYLVESDPDAPRTPRPATPTLRMWVPGSTTSRLLNPLLTVHESGLRSGCTVEVVATDDHRIGDDRLALPVALLQVTSGPDTGREFRLASGTSYVGRDPGAHVHLSDTSVSRRHASVSATEGLTVTDLNSSNGIEVDGRLVDRAVLSEGSLLRVGDTEMRVSLLTGSRPRLPQHRLDGRAVEAGGVLPGATGSPTSGASAAGGAAAPLAAGGVPPAPVAPGGVPSATGGPSGPPPSPGSDGVLASDDLLASDDGLAADDGLASDRTLGETELTVVTRVPSAGTPASGPRPVATTAAPSAGAPSPTSPDARDHTTFVRSPRVEPTYPGETVVAPELPTIPERTRFPVLAVVAPVIMGAVLFAVTRQVFSLLFIALSPVIMIGTWIDNRIQNKRRGRDERERFEESLAASRAHLEDERDRQREARVAESPSADEVAAAVRDRSPLLWTRKPEHTTFLEVRFGLGTQPSRTVVTPPSKNSSGPDHWDRVTRLVDDFAEVDGVPIIENLERAGAIGVAGDSTISRDAARSLVLQLVGLHSPADLVVTALASGESQRDWSWLTWLPHVDSPHSPLSSSGLAGDFTSATMLMAELEELVATRREAGAGRGETVRSRLDRARTADAEHGASVDSLPAVPAVLVVVAHELPADRARLVAIAEQGPDYGVFVLWLASTVASLPVVCRTYLDVDGDTGQAAVGFVRSGVRVALERLETTSSIDALEAARLLAPVEDSGAPVLDESDLPHRVGFLDLLEGRVADQSDAVVQRWMKNDSLTSAWRPGSHREPGGIRALVGQGPAEAFALDLRRHGPHALVGGTTGSGKSEFLQTWIMGMATEHSPDRVTFLLVDYKGGAAFAECVDLPHTVGLVTDLNTHLVRRALTSLRAELTHREHLLNAKGAKDLETLEKRGDRDAPPSLVIVIDEFAALAREVPEFVDGVIDVAQRGRSLGLHLIMATQRPAGVIKDNLRANTNLRVALRVSDEADSQDVLGVPTAAFFSPGTPGRAAAKLGPGRVLDFQSAYLGGWTSDDDRSRPDVEVTELVFGRGRDWVVASSDNRRDESAPRDIERLAATIRRASSAVGLAAPRRPWLEPLPDRLDLADLPPSTGSGLVIGLRDEPSAQRQAPYVLDLDRTGNVAVIGTGGSGRSAALRTVAVAASAVARQHPVWVHGIDFSGGGLASLESLPTVGSIVDGDDDERVARLFAELEALVDERSALFSAARVGSLADHRAATGTALPRVLVLVDGMAAFRAGYEFRSGGAVFDRFADLLAVGRQVGLHFVLTADRLGAFSTTLQSNLQTRLVLRLASEGDYAVAGVKPDVFVDAPAGRAVIDGLEVQLAVAGGTPDVAAQAEVVDTLAASLGDHVSAAPGVRRLPERISATSLPADVDGRPTLGLADETLAPVAVPLDGLFVVTGPFGSGRTTTMTTVLRGIRATRPSWQPYLVAARRGRLGGALDWVEASSDAESADALTTSLALRIESAPAGTELDLVVAVESVPDLEALPADGSVARLLKAARRAGVVVVAETDTITGGGAWQTFSELKAARAGIVMQPEETDGLQLFRTQFPRVTRKDFPVGRGLLVDQGRVSRVQVALPAAPVSPAQSPSTSPPGKVDSAAY